MNRERFLDHPRQHVGWQLPPNLAVARSIPDTVTNVCMIHVCSNVVKIHLLNLLLQRSEHFCGLPRLCVRQPNGQER
jgi:hypothetical protein